MSETRIQKQLNTLSDMRVASAAVEGEMKKELEAAIPAEVKAAIAAVEARYADILKQNREAIAAQESKIKQSVLAHGESVKSTTLHAIYSRGRRSWNMDALDGYCIAVPSLLAFRSEGEPSVSICLSK